MNKTQTSLQRQAYDSQVVATLDKIIVHDYDYHDIPDAVWDAWEVCNAQWHSYPWESVTWLRAAAEGLSPEISKRLLVAGDARSGPIAFWPYRVQRIRSGGMLPLMLCRPWDENPWATTSIVVSPTLGVEDCRRILDEFFQKLPKWHKMMIAMLRMPSPLLDAMLGAFEHVGIRVKRTNHTCLEIRDWNSVDEFMGSLSKKWRQQYNRLSKQYQQADTLRLEHLDGDATLGELESIKRRILGIYKESWKATSTKRHSSLMLPESYAHFSRLIEAFAKKQWLHVIFVSINGEDAGFCVGLRCENVFCSLQTAYKEKYAKLSIGFLTLMEDFRYVIERGGLTNNLMGHHPYLKHFTDTHERFSFLLAFNRDAGGTITLFLSKVRLALQRIALPFRGIVSRK